jgi:small subunit ribosomal protein S16
VVKKMVKMRLKRIGAKKKPYYRIIIADVRSPRDGKFIDQVGTYNPLANPSEIKFDEEKAKDWLKKGVQPTESVKKLLKISGIVE